MFWNLDALRHEKAAGAPHTRHQIWLPQDLADSIVPGMAGLPVPALVDAAVGCADLRFFPDEAWMDAHEGAVNGAVAGLSAYQFNLVQGAYARLELVWTVQQAAGAAGGRRRRQAGEQERGGE